MKTTKTEAKKIEQVRAAWLNATVWNADKVAKRMAALAESISKRNNNMDINLIINMIKGQ